MGRGVANEFPPTEMHSHQDSYIPTQYTLHGHTLEVVDSDKYLGVTISEDLQWSKHIDKTVSKANRTMGFIRRNLRDCTKPVKAAAYTTMARPTLECASTVWDPHSSAETHKLEQVQRRAARFVHNNYTERTPGCVTHMVQNLGWQPLQQRRYNNRLIVMFKIIHELVDVQTEVIRTGDERFQPPVPTSGTKGCSPFSLAPSGNGTICQPQSLMQTN